MICKIKVKDHTRLTPLSEAIFPNRIIGLRHNEFAVINPSGASPTEGELQTLRSAIAEFGAEVTAGDLPPVVTPSPGGGFRYRDPAPPRFDIIEELRAREARSAKVETQLQEANAKLAIIHELIFPGGEDSDEEIRSCADVVGKIAELLAGFEAPGKSPEGPVGVELPAVPDCVIVEVPHYSSRNESGNLSNLPPAAARVLGLIDAAGGATRLCDGVALGAASWAAKFGEAVESLRGQLPPPAGHSQPASDPSHK